MNQKKRIASLHLFYFFVKEIVFGCKNVEKGKFREEVGDFLFDLSHRALFDTSHS